MGYLNTEMSSGDAANLMTDENSEDWKLACKLSAQALEYGASLIRPGASVLEVADEVERKITELGGEMAFPPQISFDSVAAHSCPGAGDETVFDNQVVKLDCGVHVNGWIGDNARTVDLSGEHEDLVQASRDALEAALKMMRPGVALGEVGRTIQEVIGAAGFAPIRNLSGHGLGNYVVHISPNIPNFDTGDDTELQENQVFAVEPFATTGKGIVINGSNATIFSVVESRPQRDKGAKLILKHCQEYNGLPFAKRWLSSLMPAFKLAVGLRALEKSGALHSYPPLIEQEKGFVSQAEHTVRVADKPEILTIP